MIKTVSWTPFSAAGMTQEQTRLAIRWAMDQWNVVSGLKVVPSAGGKADITIEGADTNAWAGYAKGSRIWISKPRVMTGRDGYVLGGVVMHEIGHTLGLGHTPKTEAYRWDLMHPHGPADDFPSPRECLVFQKKWGRPASDFHVHEITYWGGKLKENGKKIDELQAKKAKLLADREEAIEDGNTKLATTLTKMIEANDQPLNHFRQTQRGWKSIYLQAIARWNGKSVPRAIVPDITKSQQAVADKAEFATIRIHDCCGFGQDFKLPTFKMLKMEPV